MATIAFRPKVGDTWYEITFRYDADLVDLIKQIIPSAYRKYDPNTHIWSTGKPWAMNFAQELVAKGHNVVGITVPAGGPGSWAAGPAAAAGGGAAGFFAATAGPGSPYGAYAPPPPGPQGPSPGSARQHYQDKYKSKTPPPMPPPPPQLTEGWARELMRRCTPEMREKVYKALAKVLHQDVGGDGTLMQELNDARNSA